MSICPEHCMLYSLVDTSNNSYSRSHILLLFKEIVTNAKVYIVTRDIIDLKEDEHPTIVIH